MHSDWEQFLAAWDEEAARSDAVIRMLHERAQRLLNAQKRTRGGHSSEEEVAADILTSQKRTRGGHRPEEDAAVQAPCLETRTANVQRSRDGIPERLRSAKMDPEHLDPGSYGPAMMEHEVEDAEVVSAQHDPYMQTQLALCDGETKLAEILNEDNKNGGNNS